MSGEADISGALDRIKGRFLATLSDQLVTMEQAHSSHAQLDATLREDALQALHRISGSAATLGMPKIGSAARRCEDLLIEDFATSTKMSPGSRAALAEVLAEAKSLLS